MILLCSWTRTRRTKMILPCYWSRIMGESGEDPDLLVLKYDENEDRSALLMV
jgi:hypothetical protein